MSRFWSLVVHGLEPYVAGEQPKLAGLVKLNTNENPYGPSPAVLLAIQAALGPELRRYPDPHATRLRAAIAARHAVEPDQVFVGNGSDEVLAHVFRALLDHERPLAMPDITYSFYPVYCRLFGIEPVLVPLDGQLRLRPERFPADCGAIILANPNAPTGIALDRAAIERLVVAHADKPVVVDEAYVDFGAESAVPLVRDHPNLLVVQTFSKSRSLAGLRVGFAIGQLPLVDALERVKDSFNSYPLDRLAIAGAVAALEDAAWFETTRRRVIASRERLAGQLAGLGFAVLPSATNFLFVSHPSHAAAELAGALRERSIIVRHFRQERIAGHLRITVGTEEECARLVEVLQQIIATTSL